MLLEVNDELPDFTPYGDLFLAARLESTIQGKVCISRHRLYVIKSQHLSSRRREEAR
jgi:hypothetical protein